MPLLTALPFMSSAWLLPEHIADVLPSEAKRIEGLRRALMDQAGAYGFELVMPPMVEYLDSLLSGTGRALGLQTFKLVDQLSGRTLGLRADTTPQVARIDAHLLNRQGVTRLCYCGPVVHTRPDGPWSTREPLQFGAEIFGHGGLEADLEVLDVALDCLKQAQVSDLVLDLGDARIARALLQATAAQASDQEALAQALAAKDGAALKDLLAGLKPAPDSGTLAGLLALPGLYGNASVLGKAQACLPGAPVISQALADLRWLARHVADAHPEVRIGFDLSDHSGHGYYSGCRFSLMGQGAATTLVRGGRYDQVGSVFGRDRPAVGFSLDLKALASVLPTQAPRPAIRAPWGQDASLRAAVRELRARGDTVVCILPGHEQEAQEFACDRELVQVAGQWVLKAID